MSKPTIVALAAIALALLGYIVVFERDSLTSGELAERKGRVLETFVRSRVSAFEIQRKGKKVRLERERTEEEVWDPWRVVSPWKEEADSEAVDTLLGELEWLDARRRLEDVSDEDLSRFGLDKPRLRLWYEAGRTRTLLEVGKPDVHGEGVYVRVDGSRDVQVVSKSLEEALNHELSHFRTKQFLGTLTVAWARYIDIHDGEQTWPLRREDDQWWFEAEPRGYGDAKAIKQWLRQFDDLRATRYVAENEADALRKQLQASAPRRTLVKIIPDAGREDKKPRILDMRVGDDCPGHEEEQLVTVGDGGPVVCVRDDALEPLFEAPGKLRLRRLFGFDVSEIEAISFETGKQSLSLERSEADWKVAGDEDGEQSAPDRQTVEKWLQDLSERVALSLAPRSPGPRVSQLTFKLADGSSWPLELGGPQLEGSVVRRGQEPLQLVFSPTTADLLTYWPGRFRSLSPWDRQPSEVVALEVRGEGGADRKLVMGESGWMVEGQSEPAPDAQRIREIVRDLVKLEVERWRAPAAEPAHGLSSPQLSIVATLASEGSDPLRLQLGAETEDSGRFAQVDGGAVAELSVQNAAMLGELLTPPQEQEQPAP